MSPISFRHRIDHKPLICHLGSNAPHFLDESIGESGKLLLRQSALSIPIPPGIILTKNVAKHYVGSKDFLETFVRKELQAALLKIDKELKTKLGHKRPGPLFSLTSTNLFRPYSFEFIGLNEKNITDFEPYCPDGKAIYLNFLRFIKDLSSFIFHIQKRGFQSAFEQIKKNEGAVLDSDVTTDGLQEACLFFLHIFKKEAGRLFPHTIEEQIELLLKAIYQRWEEESEDPINSIIGTTKPMEPELLIQGMVFSNLSAYSGQGTLYSRNPANGDLEIYGDYFQKRGSEDIFNEKALNTIYSSDIRSLQYLMPSVFNELLFFTKKIENDLQAIVRIEFTIEEGVLFITNLGKAEGQPLSILKSISHLMQEGIIDASLAILKLDPNQVQEAFLQSETFRFDNGCKKFAAAEAPSTGLCVGKLTFTENSLQGPAILFKENDADIATPEGICGVIVLKGTKSSPFFQNLRKKNIPSLILENEVILNPELKCLLFNDQILKEGDLVAIDASEKRIVLLDSLYQEISKKRCSLPFFEPIRHSANEVKSLEIIPCINEKDLVSHLNESCCINLDSMLSSLRGSQWTFFLGNDVEKKDSFERIRAALKEKLSSILPKLANIHDIHFLFPIETITQKRESSSLADYLDGVDNKPKQREKAEGIVQTLIKNHITFEEACPYLLEAITFSIADSLKNISLNKTVFFLQNIHHKTLFIAIKKRIIEKLKAEGRFSLISKLDWGITITPSSLPEDFSALISEADYLLFDMRTKNTESDPPYEILRLAVKEAKGTNPALKIGILSEECFSIPLASFAERYGIPLMITKPHLIDSCALSAAKEHIFPKTS